MTIREEPVFENDLFDVGGAEQCGALREKSAEPLAADGGGEGAEAAALLGLADDVGT